MSERYIVSDCLDRYVRAIQSGKTDHNKFIARKIPRDSSKNFHMSDAGKCPRMRILKRIGAERDEIQGISLRRFLLGDMIEGIVRASFEWCFKKEELYRGFSADWQGEVVLPEYDAIGHYDCVVTFPDKYRLLMDVKSCHGDKIDYVKSGEKDASYCMQLSSYAIGLHRQQRDVNGKMIVYIDKDTMRTHPDWVESEWERKTTDNWDGLMVHWKKYKKENIMAPELEKLRERERFTKRKRFKTPEGEGLLVPWQCEYCDLWKNCPGVKSFFAQTGHPLKG